MEKSGRYLADWFPETEPFRFDQPHHSGRSKGLGYGTELEERVLIHGLWMVHVGDAEALNEILSITGNSQDRARNFLRF